MRVLLLRPATPNERFGLGPFFQVEPLGLQYVGASLLERGHDVALHDLRFEGRVDRLVRAYGPQVVGISCMHAVDIPNVLALATRIRAVAPHAFVMVGGHAASVFPDPFFRSDVDAVCYGDDDSLGARVVDALATGSMPDEMQGVWLRGQEPKRASLDPAPGSPRPGENGADSHCNARFDSQALPARHLVSRFRRHYVCVHKQPVWAVETARGCPYRCSFCSTWRRHRRRHRLREIDTVVADLASVGSNVFIVDDLFWSPRERSLELARELGRRNVRKDWILVQTRLDTLTEHPDVVEAWRPLARQFDLFLGFEAPTDAQLALLHKDMSIQTTEEAVRIARRLGFGVTGNFVVDPDWDESGFEALWAMVDRLGLNRVGYTILTPLPGTDLFERLHDRIVDRDWSHYDMHHLLVRPRLGRQRFFELFAASWRRNVLSSRYCASKWWRWLSGLTPRQMLTLARLLWRTQRLVRADAYLAEEWPGQWPAELGTPSPRGEPRPRAPNGEIP